ncbi:hypothetical protein NLG97_g10692 [Lecanicillium saksenae]|uniref:Uncharacterized protein n=1 Tax=Lecanicillium saksenae TaxID=468837 RepID=A0ACC1QEY4_9HYPO|nr:hypothetical protein NLG97_g10692 [Lecanicillium saksenae]
MRVPRPSSVEKAPATFSASEMDQGDGVPGVVDELEGVGAPAADPGPAVGAERVLALVAHADAGHVLAVLPRQARLEVVAAKAVGGLLVVAVRELGGPGGVSEAGQGWNIGKDGTYFSE